MMVLITSPTLRFNWHPLLRSPAKSYYIDRKSSICCRNSLRRCTPWPTLERVALSRTWEKLSVNHTALVRRNSETPAVVEEEDDSIKKVLRFLLWTAEAVYILWLFLLPYAPGDPVWAISSETVNSLLDLSLNFFFVLPLMNSVGINLLQAPVLHPMSEGLFNFVIAWTLLFAPLLYTDRKRDRFKGSLDVLWGLMMFLTNTFLIPYMAIRLNKANPDDDTSASTRSQLGEIMTRGASAVALIGAAVCLTSALWAFFGRMDGGFGDISDRLQFLIGYLGSERLAYAFIWDICLYTVFQPWLIGENLVNVEKGRVGLVRFLRFVPVVGLAGYLLCLNPEEDA